MDLCVRVPSDCPLLAHIVSQLMFMHVSALIATPMQELHSLASGSQVAAMLLGPALHTMVAMEVRDAIKKSIAECSTDPITASSVQRLLIKTTSAATSTRCADALGGSRKVSCDYRGLELHDDVSSVEEQAMLNVHSFVRGRLVDEGKIPEMWAESDVIVRRDAKVHGWSCEASFARRQHTSRVGFAQKLKDAGANSYDVVVKLHKLAEKNFLLEDPDFPTACS